MKQIVAANLFRGKEADMTDVQPANRLGFLPACMVVSTKTTRKYRFMV